MGTIYLLYRSATLFHIKDFSEKFDSGLKIFANDILLAGFKNIDSRT